MAFLSMKDTCNSTVATTDMSVPLCMFVPTVTGLTIFAVDWLSVCLLNVAFVVAHESVWGLSLFCLYSPVCPMNVSITIPVWQLSGRLPACQALSEPLCRPCQACWDRRRLDVMATMSYSPQIFHTLTGPDWGWASKLLATIKDTSKRMGLTCGSSHRLSPLETGLVTTAISYLSNVWAVIHTNTCTQSCL